MKKFLSILTILVLTQIVPLNGFAGSDGSVELNKKSNSKKKL